MSKLLEAKQSIAVHELQLVDRLNAVITKELSAWVEENEVKPETIEVSFKPDKSLPWGWRVSARIGF